ncbi:MAG: peptidoglycan-binding protein [Saprospiraceae bacterium]|nr:peptidoglycan-binding protein [Saprospiraceae bacterium]
MNQYYIKFILPLLLGFAASGMAQSVDVPPNAQAGKCYAKCHFADVYETTTEQVAIKPATTQASVVPAEYEMKNVFQLVKAESKRIIMIPAQFETLSDRVDVTAVSKGLAPGATATKYVMVKPESKRYVEVPAVYETVEEPYVIEPATTRIEVHQPRYETVTERIEKIAASTKWVKKKADFNCLNANPDDCLVWCLVETPAEYQTLTKRVNKGCDGSGGADAGCIKTIEVPAVMGTRSVQRIKKPTSVREEYRPAEYKAVAVRSTDESIAVSKQFLKTPPSFREEFVPAEYKAVLTKAVKKQASSRTETIPPEYIAVTKRKLVKAGGFSEWREVLCEEKLTGYKISEIQMALKKAGYYTGTADNKMGAGTKAALSKFQKDKGLPVGNIDLETLKALGVNY